MTTPNMLVAIMTAPQGNRLLPILIMRIGQATRDRQVAYLIFPVNQLSTGPADCAKRPARALIR